jgi:hypothetical protein
MPATAVQKMQNVIGLTVSWKSTMRFQLLVRLKFLLVVTAVVLTVAAMNGGTKTSEKSELGHPPLSGGSENQIQISQLEPKPVPASSDIKIGSLETAVPVENLVSESTLTFDFEYTFTLEDYINVYFEPEDRALMLRIAFCESTGFPDDTSSDAINRSSGAAGWFQHLPKFWEERTEAAGIAGADILDPVTNVFVASWLFYETPQKTSHWYPSEQCWG